MQTEAFNPLMHMLLCDADSHSNLIEVNFFFENRRRRGILLLHFWLSNDGISNKNHWTSFAQSCEIERFSYSAATTVGRALTSKHIR